MSNQQHGCDIPAVLAAMRLDQGEHLYAKFSSAYLKYRKVVAEWMVDVTEFFHLHPTTTHAAIAYLDRLQPNEKFSRFEWQMLAICCILISSKYNECEEHLPGLNRLEEITQQTISNESVLNYELWALKRMGWKLNARTTIAFLTSYIALGIVSPLDSYTEENVNYSPTSKSNISRVPETIKAKMEKECNEYATITLLDVRFKNIPCNAVACAIIYKVRSQNNITPVWNKKLTVMTTYDPLRSESVLTVLTLLDPVISAKPPPVPMLSPTKDAPSSQRLNTPTLQVPPKSEVSPVSVAQADFA